MTNAPSDDDFRDALDILRTSKVKTWNEGQCEADVQRCLENICTTWKNPPPDPMLRKDLEAASRALRNAARLVPWCFEDIHGHIADASAWIAFHVDRLKASKDSGPKTTVPKTKVKVPLNTSAKYAAAWSAHFLIRHWSTKAPTLTAGGPYFSLARLLYKAATGHSDAARGQGIEGQCRKVAREWSARNKAAVQN